MKKQTILSLIFTTLLLFVLLLFAIEVNGSELVPSGNINLKGIYNLTNVSAITGFNLEGSILGGTDINASRFFGEYDWTILTGISTNYLIFNGTVLEFNETALNLSIAKSTNYTAGFGLNLTGLKFGLNVTEVDLRYYTQAAANAQFFNLSDEQADNWNYAHTYLLAESERWNYTNDYVLGESGSWNDTRALVTAGNVVWNYTNTYVLAESGAWNDSTAAWNANGSYIYEYVRAESGSWNDTRALVTAGNVAWNYTNTYVLAESFAWNYTNLYVLAESGRWNYTNDYVLGESGSWNTTRDLVADGNVTINWTNLQNYPSECPANSFVSTINDTITCTIPNDNDSVYYTLFLNQTLGITDAAANAQFFNQTGGTVSGDSDFSTSVNVTGTVQANRFAFDKNQYMTFNGTTILIVGNTTTLEIW